ncbi:hypothetical protein JHD48_05680 [Sulfurimonas sp. SAG-AH-194-I05]|nr:hypothetical protein [Sulfurimonas sp. SAG-AH-194-I05]MDF1875215.1 hypothetical protein [Sulfurimonas sp. SAG-AH-194-I05]
MEKYIIIEEINNHFTLKIENKKVLKYIKQLLTSNFSFKFTECEHTLEGYTILDISSDISSDVFYRHFEIITLSILDDISSN